MDTITIKKAVMRPHRSESYLKARAEEMAETIYLDNWCGDHSKRKTNTHERDILYTIAYGALLSLNWGETARSIPEVEQGIVETAEFTAIVRFGDMYFPENKGINKNDPYTERERFRVNTYDSIYLKLRHYIDTERLTADEQ